MHLNIANTIRPDTKSTDYTSRDTIPLQTNDTEENYKKSFWLILLKLLIKIVKKQKILQKSQNKIVQICKPLKHCGIILINLSMKYPSCETAQLGRASTMKD